MYSILFYIFSTELDYLLKLGLHGLLNEKVRRPGTDLSVPSETKLRRGHGKLQQLEMCHLQGHNFSYL